jgi:hypothetical protein
MYIITNNAANAQKIRNCSTPRPSEIRILVGDICRQKWVGVAEPDDDAPIYEICVVLKCTQSGASLDLLMANMTLDSAITTILMKEYPIALPTFVTTQLNAHLNYVVEPSGRLFEVGFVKLKYFIRCCIFIRMQDGTWSNVQDYDKLIFVREVVVADNYNITCVEVNAAMGNDAPSVDILKGTSVYNKRARHQGPFKIGDLHLKKSTRLFVRTIGTLKWSRANLKDNVWILEAYIIDRLNSQSDHAVITRLNRDLPTFSVWVDWP